MTHQLSIHKFHPLVLLQMTMIVLAVMVSPLQAATNTFNGGAITINDTATNGSPAAASPSPSTVTVSGVGGTVSQVTATITGYSHSFTVDVDMMLVGPGGQSVMLMSDAWDVDSPTSGSATFTFSDTAAGPVPGDGNYATGTYQPTDYESGEPTGSCQADSLSPTGTTLAVFNGLSGASVNGTWSLFITDDCAGDSGSVTSWSLTITDSAAAAPNITSGAPGGGTVGSPYSHTYTATGDATITYAVTSGALPTNLTLSPAGVLNGTPSSPGTFTGIVTATNGAGTDTQNFSITIGATPSAPIITSAAPAGGTVGVAYSHTYTATGDAPITYALTSGSLPSGLTLTSAGVLTGIPTAEGTFIGSVTATNGIGSNEQSFTMTVSLVPVVPPSGAPTVVSLPEPPPAAACSDTNFDADGMVRTNFTNDADRGVHCRVIANGGSYMTWLGGSITFPSMIGDSIVLDLGVIGAVDVFSPSGVAGFVGDVNICLKGSGYMIYMNANTSPRVPQLWSNWTTDAFPGYTCTTLYAPGTVILVTNKP